MLITYDNHKEVDSENIRIIVLDIKFYFYSFMEYSDNSIATIINKHLSRNESSFRIDPSFVRAVRCGNI